MDTPAVAGEQLILGPTSPGASPATAQVPPEVPLERDRALPEVSRANDTHCPAAPTVAPDSAPRDAATLAQLIAAGRKPRSLRFAELEPYRDVLLAERRAGASIRLMAQSLAKVGVAISEETLRVWLLRQKMPKRRRPRKRPAPATLVQLKPSVLPRPAASVTPSSVPTGYVPRRGPRIARDDF